MGFKRDVDEPAHNHIQPSSQHSPAIWGRPGSAIPLYDYDYLTHADNGKLGEARVCNPSLWLSLSCRQGNQILFTSDPLLTDHSPAIWTASCSVPHTLIVSLSVGLYSRHSSLRNTFKSSHKNCLRWPKKFCCIILSFVCIKDLQIDKMSR